MQPLTGVRIVVTRAASQAEEMAAPLRDLGADVLLLPMIEIAPPADPGPLRAAAARVEEYDWIVFTSGNAVQAFAAALPEPARVADTQIATVGAATRHAAEERGWVVSFTPAEYVADAVIEGFRAYELRGRRILIPSSAIARDAVAAELRRCGAQVDVVEAYRNVLPRNAVECAREVFREPWPDWVAFASSSAVRNLVQVAGAEVLRRVKIASIGPVTSRTVAGYGLQVAAEAAPHTVEGLVRAIGKAETLRIRTNLADS